MTISIHSSNDEASFEVAIVGGGIVGVVLAIGLLQRKINVRIYEQARSFREIGAGVAFTANAIQCMHRIDPAIVTALKRVATANGDPDEPTDYLQWADGFNQAEDEESKILFRLDVGRRGFEGCHRAHLLDELVKLIPPGVVHFQKRVIGYIDHGDDDVVDDGKRAEAGVTLLFEDGSTTTADAVVACDGIKSRIRQIMLGPEEPSAFATYTHKVAYRALVPMEQAVAAVGEKVPKTQRMHLGPGAHVLHFPVNDHKMLNIVAFVADPDDWPWDAKLAGVARKQDVVDAFAEWGPTVRGIVSLLNDKMDRWAIFDTADHPAATYAKGRVCLAGDAAHASSPHHGAGGGIGVEDALALSHLFELVAMEIRKSPANGPNAVREAFQIFDGLRRPRTQWFVQSSRDVCTIYELEHAETGNDLDKVFAEIKWRSHKIWYFDIDGMERDIKDRFHERVSSTSEARG